jgi:hypothetical protein
MSSAKRLIQLGRMGAGLTVGLVAAGAIAPVVQAATITGQATGIWNNPNTVAGVTVGDAFTATFAYDDAAIQTAVSSAAGNTQETYQVALTRLLFESGSVSQVFTTGLLSGVTNSNSALGSVTNLFGNFDSAEKSASLTIAKIFTGDASTSLSAANFFVAPKSAAGGTAVNAVASFPGEVFDGIQFGGVPSNSAAVPEPTTMLGLLGASVGLAIAKRKQRRQS